MLTVDDMIKQKDYLFRGRQYMIEMYYGRQSPVAYPSYYVYVFDVMGDYPILENAWGTESRWDAEALYSNPFKGVPNE